jgi:ubiquinone/menaquinone biosynthesis C-methylase UbiE
MGFYREQVLPRILNRVMGRRVVAEERKKTLAGVSGAVLEVGFGSGQNLPFYPPEVRKLVAVDPSTVAASLARERIARVAFPVEYVALEGERIDAPDASFDAVVSTFTLCTIPDAAAALAQMRRMLRPGGRFFFVEHGRAPDAKVQRWQDRLNGVNEVLLGGCHLNRDIERLVRDAGFELERVDKHYMEGAPRFAGFLTRGVGARRS